MSATVRDLINIATMRAEDRSLAATRRGRRKKVYVAPRLVVFLVRRRIGVVRETARRLLVERPANRWSQFLEFLRYEDVTLTELIYAVGFLAKATIYPVAAFLLAIAFLTAALSNAGLL